MTCANPMMSAMTGGAVNFEFKPANYSANGGHLSRFPAPLPGPIPPPPLIPPPPPKRRKRINNYLSSPPSLSPTAPRSPTSQKGGNAYYGLSGTPNLPLGPNSGYGDLNYYADTAVNKQQFPTQIARQSGGKSKRRQSFFKQIGCNKRSHRHRGFQTHKKSSRTRVRKSLRRKRGGAKSTRKVLPRSLRRHLGVRNRGKSMRGGSSSNSSSNSSMSYSNFPTTKYTFSPGQVSDPSLIGLANPSPITAIKGCETINRF